MLPQYPERWPFEHGPILDALDALGGLLPGKNHMVLVRKGNLFDNAIGQSLDDFLAEHFPMLTRGKTTLSQLQPGSGHRGMHVDVGGAIYDDGKSPYRFHVPLRTNDGAFFDKAGEKYGMPTGFIYRVNPLEPHTAGNAGHTVRIHLFFNGLEKNDG